MKKEILTLKSTNERIDSLESKLDQILKALSKDNEYEETLFEINTKTLQSGERNPEGFIKLFKSKSKEFVDEHENIFVQLPTIWVKFDEDELLFVFEEKEDYIKFQPQAISKYKGALVEGKLRSIPNVAPDFTQFSFNKATKFCKWVDGEQLNWKTVLYIQIMWAYAYGTKNNNDILPNEKYNWINERDCAFGDTGRGVGEFLGIEQLFTSGRNFVDISGIYCIDDALWSLYKKWNFNESFDPSGKFAVWGDYDPDEDSKAVFFSAWGDGFGGCWGAGGSAVRLCKCPQ